MIFFFFFFSLRKIWFLKILKTCSLSFLLLRQGKRYKLSALCLKQQTLSISVWRKYWQNCIYPFLCPRYKFWAAPLPGFCWHQLTGDEFPLAGSLKTNGMGIWVVSGHIQMKFRPFKNLSCCFQQQHLQFVCKHHEDVWNLAFKLQNCEFLEHKQHNNCSFPRWQEKLAFPLEALHQCQPQSVQFYKTIKLAAPNTQLAVPYIKENHFHTIVFPITWGWLHLFPLLPQHQLLSLEKGK